MLLAIDVGNTNSKFALFDDGRIVARFRLQTQANRPADEYAASLTQLMALRGIGPKDVEHAIMSTVVPAVTFNMRTLCDTHFGTELMVIGEPNVDLGIKILIDRPQEAGADRLVGTIAGYRKYGGPLIVIDFGSATTFDIADADGNFYGGVISPGVELAIEAFYLMTARLPRIRVEKPAAIIGKGTVGAMQSGIFWGYLGLIETLVARIKAEYGEPMRVIATGGLASIFQAETRVIEAVEPDLMLDGLYEIFCRNRRN